jgi:uncharacterized membrane protein
VTVHRTPEEVYRAWRDFERLPRLISTALVSVTPVGRSHTRWTVRGPAGVSLAWDAELIADEPGRLLAWRSIGSPDLDIAGSVRFSPAPGGRGTEMKVILTFAPPGGRIGAAAAALIGHGGDRHVREALRRFKQVLETGEVATGERRRSEQLQQASPTLSTARSA